MSADKHRSRQRRMTLLQDACTKGGIPLHCEGGMAMDNPDLQRLITAGHMKVVRSNHPKWSAEWARTFRRGEFRLGYGYRGIHGFAFRTYAVLTERGRGALRTRRI